MLQGEYNPGGLSSTAPFNLKVSLGAVGGWTAVNKFGRNVNVDTAASEDVWDFGGLWTSPTGSSLIQVFSANAGDSATGVGAQTVTLQGLNSAGALSSETVSMAGATRVATTSSFSMVHRMFTASAGSSGVNIGAISALNPQDTTLTLAQMSARNNQSLMAIYRVPANKTGLLANYYLTVTKSGGANTNPNAGAFLYIQSSIGGVWQLKHVQGTENTLSHEFVPPLAVTANQTIRIEAQTDSAQTDIAAGFDLYLKDN